MKKLFASIFILFAVNAFSQSLSRQVIANAGDYFEAGGYSLSWTLGEPVSETFSSADYHLTQGFQQPDLLAVKISETQPDVFSLVMYPNPVKDELTLSWNNVEAKSILIHLYDAAGKMILKEEVPASQQKTTVKFGSYAAGQYSFSVMSSDGKQRSTYQISKIK